MIDLSVLSSSGPAVGAIIAAAITAAFASLKLYSDKAAKVTEFRQAWIETLRQALAEFSGSTHTIAGRIAIRNRHDGSGKENSQGLPSLIKVLTPVKSRFDKEFETELLEHWSTLRLSYNKIILHLNPAEHFAYLQAEKAIAAFTDGRDEDATTRQQVVDFLYWCIRLAERNARQYIGQPHLLSIPGTQPHGAPMTNDDLASTVYLTGQKGVQDLSNNAASCLLLATFATRQLLHGSYEEVLRNIAKIEHGIRVVDTSAAIVIKGVWEDIKQGEPGYRKTSSIALGTAVFLLAAIVTLILLFPSEKKQAQKLTISCTLPAPFTLFPNEPATPFAPTSGARVACEATAP